MNGPGTRALRVAAGLTAALAILGLLLLVVQASIGVTLPAVHVGTWRIPSALGMFFGGLVTFIVLDRVRLERERA